MNNKVVSKKIPSGKNVNTLLVYLHDDYKIKLLHYIMLPRTSVYVEGYYVKTKWMYFFDSR